MSDGGEHQRLLQRLEEASDAMEAEWAMHTLAPTPHTRARVRVATRAFDTIRAELARLAEGLAEPVAEE